MPTDPAPVAASLIYGQLTAFDPNKELISTYLERVELYLDVNNVKKASVLLTVIGPETYATVRSLVAPTAPKSKTFKELEESLKSHYEPKALVIAPTKSDKYRECARVLSRIETASHYV